MKEPDPLEETDIYATVKDENTEDTKSFVQVDSEQTEMDDDINDLLA